MPFAALLIVFCLARTVSAQQQVEYLKEAYKRQGDALFVPLYWLPETHSTTLRHIPKNENWIRFEPSLDPGLWRQIPEPDKLKLLEELGQEFEEMESTRLNAIWARVRGWQPISTQLSLLTTFHGSQEGFLDLAYVDPVLQPAFKWILDQRRPDFDPKYIGGTISSAQHEPFHVKLVEHLLNTPEQERMECFSRLFARIAESKANEAEQ